MTVFSAKIKKVSIQKVSKKGFFFLSNLDLEIQEIILHN